MVNNIQSRPWFSIAIVILLFLLYFFFLRSNDPQTNIETLFIATWVLIAILFEALKFRLLLEKYSNNTGAVIASKNFQDSWKKTEEAKA